MVTQLEIKETSLRPEPEKTEPFKPERPDLEEEPAQMESMEQRGGDRSTRGGPYSP
ncbi:MAG: hypothetical protein GY696_35030 [Gammaproteobacteria bacterium]|nr:hypothetical protein [Gammaproteobacteria bacterium]